MESVYLNQFINYNKEEQQIDTNEPLSFLEWKRQKPDLIEKQAAAHYNLYVINWFQNNKRKPLSTKFLLKQKYLYLLFQLHVFFTEEEKQIWYNKINFADERELLISIPFFARKLKQIALYYLHLRKKLKNTKLKYNLAGTSFGLEQEIYNLFIRTFTDFNNEALPNLLETLPSLSGIRDSLVVQIEDIYDDVDYFDKSTTIPISGYYNLFHAATEKFYQTKGITLSSSEWVFSALNASSSDSVDLFVSQLTGAFLEVTSALEYEEFIKNFIAENKFLTSFVKTSASPDVITIDIQQGNNAFYYPYGFVDPSILFERQIVPVALSSITLEGATAGNNLETSDTIFIKNGNEVSGAWLYYKQYEDVTENLRASFAQNATTTFVFPFPGYGLSGEDLPWTGRSVKYTPGFNFLTNEMKTLVNKEYWTSPLENSNIEPILLNNTTLISQKATANTNPKFADQITTSLWNVTNNLLPAVDTNGSWLYKFLKTAWPIGKKSPNVFLWPYHIVDPEQDDMSYLYSQIYMKDVCDTVKLSTLNFSFAIAASSIEFADKIYKLHNFSDVISQATECCWLSSCTTTFNATKYKTFGQNGFSALFDSEKTTRFLWTGPTTDLSAVFVPNITHKPECYFSTANLSLTSNLEWEKCSCKQVYYSPFGHPGKTFEENNGFADFIAKDATNNLFEFDFDSWRSTTNSRFWSSPDVAWYKTKKTIGWGGGEWISNVQSGGAPFKLEPGKTYFYRRAGSRLNSSSFPAYSVNYDFGSKQARWITAKQNDRGEWVSFGEPSAMSFKPGDFIKYERAQSTQCWLMSSRLVEEQSTNYGSKWSTFDYIASGSALGTTYISWPMEDNQMLSDPQLPPVTFFDVEKIYFWEIQNLQKPWLISRYYSTQVNIDIPGITGFTTATTQTVVSNKMSFAFTPPETGTYKITVSASAKGVGDFSFTDIPLLTVVPPYREEELLVPFNFPSSGFLFEETLTGWNYNTNKAKPKALGAKPYWADLYLDKQLATRFRGVLSWGFPYNFLEDYLPDHAPRLSLLRLNYGTIVKYKRQGYDLIWSQPFIFKNYSGTSIWCQISSITTPTSNLSALFNTKRIDELNVIPTKLPTDILLTNIKNSLPVEIYYNALNSFTWPITSEIQIETTNESIETAYESQNPWNNLNNRFFSTIATLPVLEDLYSLVDVGGYFIPQHLGASQFINKDFEHFLKTNDAFENVLVEDTSIHIGGRGRTKQDQPTIYDWQEQNQWMKEPPSAGVKSGAVKSEWTKTLQTFLPYEENSEEVSLGLVTPWSKNSPWGGKEGDEWIDTLNHPKSLTEVPNVSAWIDTQVLKNSNQIADNWITDIFGNQYALYKQLTNIAVGNAPKKTGELWVKTNSGRVLPAYKALSAVFNAFKYESFYSELTGNGIKTVDCFFDTILFETETSVVLFQLEYDYNTEEIGINVDNTIIVSDLYIKNLRFERSWLTPKTKTIALLFTDFNSSSFIPTIYTLNLANRVYARSFPITLQDYTDISAGLSGISIHQLDKAAYYFNSLLQTSLITYKGVDKFNKLFFVDFEIEHQENLILKTINRFIDTTYLLDVQFPPIVDEMFFEPIPVTTGFPFVISVTASNSPLNYEILGTPPFPITVSPTGMFSGTVSLSGLYYVNYRVINQIGYTSYGLTINAT